MSKAAELAALIGSQSALSNRNLIINGDMQCWQRATSATAANNSYGTVDRFVFNESTDGAKIATVKHHALFFQNVKLRLIFTY